jgi:predicted phosphoribosyltransferase
LKVGRLIEDTSLRDRAVVFRDRLEAGTLLARELKDYKATENAPRPIVLAVPSGGVPVASVIAKALALALDLIIVRKIQIPDNPEAGFGAVGPEGEVILNEDLIDRLGLSEKEIQNEIEKTREVNKRREALFRGGRPFPAVTGRAVIIVDDGLASGYTMLSAVEFVKRRSAEKVVCAVPTAPKRTIDSILPLVDELFCLNVRCGYYFAVARAYENWYDLGDDEVISIIKGRAGDGG